MDACQERGTAVPYLADPNERIDTESFTNTRSLLEALAKGMNLVNPNVELHHEQTAYLTFFICSKGGLDLARDDLTKAVYAALLHDVGSVVIHHQATIAEIESQAVAISKRGARMLSDLRGFEEIAGIVGHCQCKWTDLVQEGAEDERTYRLKQIASAIHLADVVSLSLDQGKFSENRNKAVLDSASQIKSFAKRCRGTEFSPEVVDAFLAVTEPEYIWLDIVNNPSFLLLFTGKIGTLSLAETIDHTLLMSRIIDYRSPFTAMHSAGVSASARKLAELAGMSELECTMMEIAGNMHDVGKLRVPREILEKPGKLTASEFNIIKEHTYFTRLILMGVPGFGRIANWASFHHEKLNGCGYPFRLSADDLDLGARIMAVADIFSAVAEDRPYRAPMDRDHALAALKDSVNAGAICGDLVALLAENYDEVDGARNFKSHVAGKRYYDSLA